VFCGLAAVGCGSSAHHSISNTRGLERALLSGSGPPRPTFASCRPETANEQAASPFGHSSRPLFLCMVAVNGQRGRYDVQVLANGCYVAERRVPGQALYGCGAGRA
jgi:hypothetical protein